MSEPLVIAGSLAQKPGQGGHAWVFLQYLLGFRRLGWDVLFLDELSPEGSRDAEGRSCSLDSSVQLAYLKGVMERFGLSDSWALIDRNDGRCLGLPRDRVLEQVRRAPFVLNVMGYLSDHEVLSAARRRVFLDIDPGFGQMWQALGLHDPFHGHDDYVTIGENIGRPNCTIPTCGLPWITTPQPVVLEHWPVVEGGEAFTSIASWRGAYGPIEYQGETYGLRVHEFRQFFPLPDRTGETFELALDIHPSEENDLARLREHGWTLVPPQSVASTPDDYQQYIQRSGAEFMVAKNMYVRSRSGWFSDRSIGYLASGKSVLAQDTGFCDLYPTGEGLIAFSTLEEAIAGVEEIRHDPGRHRRKAREIAEGYFDSDRVLTRLLGKLGVA